MFLEGYKRNWLHTEGYAFEDRMIDDLSVRTYAWFMLRCRGNGNGVATVHTLRRH